MVLKVGGGVVEGWIKLYRCLLDKSIWQCSTPEQKVVLITLLLMANHEENEWEWQGKKFKCSPGQFITSLDGIAKECGKGVSIKNIRTALEKFEKYEFLANQSAKTGRLITILNWEHYQDTQKDNGKDVGKRVANRRQRGGKEGATNKNDNNDKELNIYTQVINYLNEKAETAFRSTTKKTKDLISARQKDGFVLDDFKKVIDIKATEWKGTDMQKYLRPETLFGTKFEGYLNQKVSISTNEDGQTEGSWTGIKKFN